MKTFKEIRENKQRNIKVKKGGKTRMLRKQELSTYLQMGWKEIKEEDSDPCWKGYEMIGMKKGKDGKEVPNCVPKESVQEEAIDENRLLKVSKLSSAEYQKAKKLKGFDKTNYTWNSDEQLYIKKTKNESVELDESLRKDIAQLSSKFPEGSKVRCKKSGKTGKVLTVGKDFIKVAVDGGKDVDYKPSELESLDEATKPLINRRLVNESLDEASNEKSQYWVYDPKSNTTVMAVDSVKKGKEELEAFKRTKRFSGGANYVLIDFGQPEHLLTGHKVDKKATPFKVVK